MNCLVEMEDDAKMYNDIDMEYVPEVPSGVMGFGDVGGRRYRKVYLCWLAFALVLTLIVYRGTAGLGWERVSAKDGKYCEIAKKQKSEIARRINTLISNSL